MSTAIEQMLKVYHPENIYEQMIRLLPRTSDGAAEPWLQC